MNTLPDYLKEGLDIVLVGLNPSLYSVEVGHYFATPRNRFWRAINRSGLLAEPLDANTDYKTPEQGIGMTDIVKRPTRGASDLRAADYREWAPVLKEKLERFQPLVVCFHGAVAYRNYLRHADGYKGVINRIGFAVSHYRTLSRVRRAKSQSCKRRLFSGYAGGLV